MIISLIKQDHPKQMDDDVIQKGIITFNESVLGERPHKFSIYLKDEEGTSHGGITVWVHSESIYIDILWIEETLRKKGFGTQLMQAAEAEGKKRGCKFATVDTLSFQAEDFYLKNGYQKLGEIKNFLFHYSRIFFRKNL